MRTARLPFLASPALLALLPLVSLLAGCSWSWGYSDSRTIWSPSPERPMVLLPPTRPLQVWMGVPPAVWLTAEAPAGQWPEYEPMSKPWETAIWVAEHWDWDWDGVDGFVWMRGAWIDSPGDGYEWNPPRWVHDEHGTYFMAGFFCAPPGVVDCPSCAARQAARPSRIACRAGLDDLEKRALARRTMPPPPTAVARQ
jgi:hypothetical protein